MARGGSGGRTTWKDRLDRTGWVDDSQWAEAGTDPDVEFVEVEPSAYRLSSGTDRPDDGVKASMPTRLIGLGAVAVVLVTLALLARPGDEEAAFDQLPPYRQQELLQRQAEAQAPAAAEGQPGNADGAIDGPTEQAEGSAESGDADPRPQLSRPLALADVQEELADLPGVLYLGLRDGAALAAISAGATEAVEFRDGEAGSDGSALGHRLRFYGGRLAALDEPAQPFDHQLLIGDEAVFPSDDGPVVIDPERAAPSLDVLGLWQGRLLVHKVGQVWLVDRDGESQPVAEGQPLAYDGRNLAMLVCPTPTDCRIETGPPDDPARRSLPVPVGLADRPLAGWTGTVAISADGDRLAVVDRRSISVPRWIDLAAGQDRAVLETIDPEAEIAWSPDGRWLAYTGLDSDLLLWDTDTDERLRVSVPAFVTDLVWLDAP